MTARKKKEEIVEELAEAVAVADQTIELQAQTIVLTDLAEKMAADRTEQQRSRRIARNALIAAIIVGVMGLVELGVVLTVAVRQNSATDKITEVLTIVDPHSKRGREAAKAQEAYRASYMQESDCRTRRALAHLSEPKVGEKCELPPPPVKRAKHK